MTIELFCSKCNGNAEAFTIKDGNLICSKCAIEEQEEEEEKIRNKFYSYSISIIKYNTQSELPNIYSKLE